jgi:LacI family transcriptional regulator
MEAIGYRGAEELDKLMRCKSSPSSDLPVRIAPSRLVVRKSSDAIAVSHAGIARSLRFMWEHCGDVIGVSDLAQAAQMSRRSFHDAFVKHVGRPPGEELQHIRIELAKRLLLESDEKLDSIAEQCGYQGRNSLWVAFHQLTGTSPVKFRSIWRKHQELQEGK